MTRNVEEFKMDRWRLVAILLLMASAGCGHDVGPVKTKVQVLYSGPANVGAIEFRVSGPSGVSLPQPSTQYGWSRWSTSGSTGSMIVVGSIQNGVVASLSVQDADAGYTVQLIDAAERGTYKIVSSSVTLSVAAAP